MFRVRDRGHREVVAAREIRRGVRTARDRRRRGRLPVDRADRAGVLGRSGLGGRPDDDHHIDNRLRRARGRASHGGDDRHLRAVPDCRSMVASRVVAGARTWGARGGRGTRAADARVGGRARTARRSRSPPLGPTRRRQRADDRAKRGVRGRPGRDRDRAGEPRAPVGVASRVGGAPRRWRDAGSRRHVAGRRRAGRRVPSRPR